MNVLKHVALAKIPRIVITSSFVTVESFSDTSVFLRDRMYTDKGESSLILRYVSSPELLI